MRRSATFLPLVGTLVLLLATAEQLSQSANASAAPVISSSSREVARIRAHFDSVLTELTDRDVRSLTIAQREQRLRLVMMLQRYRDRGVFPRNYDFPGQAVPYFVDRKTGVLCAVAHLMASTGRRDIVDRVAATDNNVRVAQLANDTAFKAWLDEHGLTLSEAARIQVPYEEGAPSAYSMATVPVAGISLLSAGWNATANRSGTTGFATGLGLVSGVMALGLGMLGPSAADAPMSISMVNVVAGAASFVLAVRSNNRHRRSVAAQRATERAVVDTNETDGVQTVVTPIVPSLNQRSAGVAVQIRF